MTHGRRGASKGKRTLAPTAKQAQTSLDTNFLAFASAMTNLTAEGTVDGVLGTSHYTAAMGMVFTQCPRPSALFSRGEWGAASQLPCETVETQAMLDNFDVFRARICSL